MPTTSTAMIEHQRAAVIVESVNQVRADVLEAFRLLADAKKRLGAVLGDGYHGGYVDHLWDRDISDSDLIKKGEKSDTLIARNTWRYLMQTMKLYDYMTEARQKEFEAQLDTGNFPALTVENIQHTFEGLTNQVGTLLVESVKEVFDWLRPQSRHGVGALKTNKKFQVGYKVIVGGMVTTDFGGGFHLQYSQDKHIASLGKVLSLLDGQGVPQYPHDLRTKLNSALSAADAGDLAKTPYLTARPRKNGHLEIVFTRHDLIDRLNQIGSDGSLGTQE